jgi:hypothetical protein
MLARAPSCRVRQLQKWERLKGFGVKGGRGRGGVEVGYEGAGREGGGEGGRGGREGGRGGA